MAAVPDLDRISSPQAREVEATRQHGLQQQLRLLRDGRLYLAPGDMAEPLDYLDQRITEVRTRRDREQASFDSHLRQAEVWLGETVTT